MAHLLEGGSRVRRTAAALEALVPRYEAIEAAGAALAALGGHCGALDGLPGNGPAILRLAIAAAA